MIEIKDLLFKFKKIFLDEDIKRDFIIQALKEVVGLNINKKDIIIKNEIIYLNIKPIYKSQILLKQDKLKEKLLELNKRKKFKVL